MRIGLSLSASPEGALATAWTGTPKSLAPCCSTGRTAEDAGTQMAPAPRSCPSASMARFTQYTLQLAFSSRFTSLNELLMRWLIKRSEEHTSELQSRGHLVCRLLLEKKKNKKIKTII